MNISIDYYEVLGIRADAPLKLINSAHKAMLREFHPDSNPHRKAEATKRSALINEAKKVLSNSNTRAIYDKSRVSQEPKQSVSEEQMAQAQKMKKQAEAESKRAKQATKEAQEAKYKAESLLKCAEYIKQQVETERDNLERNFYHEKSVKSENLRQAVTPPNLVQFVRRILCCLKVTNWCHTT